MNRISILPDHVASQIAAGEVVERPSSVVKELVENAIDSGATNIEVDVSKDARDIRVADNGCGMSPEDATLAFQRHATSKLSSASDLESLSTLGFRGEALPSIASISKFTCLTRAEGRETGTKIEIKDSKVEAVETGCSKGTVMDVRELFYNVPARLKFLKRASTEAGHIQEIIQSLAVSYPHIGFEFRFNGNKRLNTSGSGDLHQTIVETKLVKESDNLCEVSLNDPVVGVSVHGFAARPTQFRGDKKGILTIVNGRPVRCPLTLKALDYAYSDLIPRGKSPIAVISIELAQNEIDVNIHPTKKEIKYSNSHNVYTTLHRAIGTALREPRKELVEAMARGREERMESESFYSEAPETFQSQRSQNPVGYDRAGAGRLTRESAEWNYDSSETFEKQIEPASQSTEQLSFAEELSYTPDTTANTITSVSTVDYLRNHRDDSQLFIEEEEISLPAGWRLAGYLHNTYYLFETREGIELIEQHIAHERYLYEKILANQETRGRTSEDNQMLCISVPLELSSEQIEVLKESQKELAKLGFEFEISDSDGISCSQVPIQLAHQNYPSIIQTMLDELDITQQANITLDATKSLACQSAIKNGMPLSERDILKLVSAWLKTERHDTCPHGRPVRLKFSRNKLFEMFHPA